jgi:hypothetical protein
MATLIRLLASPAARAVPDVARAAPAAAAVAAEDCKKILRLVGIMIETPSARELR